MPGKTNKRQSGHHTGLSQAHDQVQELRMGMYITRITQHNMMHTQVGPCLPLLSRYGKVLHNGQICNEQVTDSVHVSHVDTALHTSLPHITEKLQSIIILYYTMQGCMYCKKL